MDFAQQQRLLNERKRAAQHGGAMPEGASPVPLFDEGSFVQISALAQDAAAVAGSGLVSGRPVFLLAQEADNQGGALSLAQVQKTLRLLDMAQNATAPLVLRLESRGAKVLEGAPLLAGYGQVFAKLTSLRGTVPLIAVLEGPVTGIGAHFAALCDVAIAVEKKGSLLAQPATVIAAVHNLAVDAQAMGGAQALAASGSVAFTAADEAAAWRLVATLLNLLGHGGAESGDADNLNRLVAQSEGLELARQVMDKGSALELYAAYGPACHTLLGTVGGHACGIVASQGDHDGGRLDAPACDKIARLVTLCDAFGLPVITLVDSQGLAVAKPQDQAWLLRASGDMLAAYAGAGCPRIAVLCANAVGAAYVSLAGRGLADITYAWPDAYVAPLTCQAGVQTLQADKLASQPREQLENEYARQADGFAAAQNGLADEVIDPAQTRKYLIAALEMLSGGGCG